MKYITFILCFFVKTFFLSAHNVDYSLYFVALRDGLSQEQLTEKIIEAVQGGVTIVQIDEHERPYETAVAFAKNLNARLAPYNVPLIINGQIDVAKASGAQGVHFLRYDPDLLQEARSTLGQDAIIGFSATTHNRTLALQGLENDTIADYISLGPLFPSVTYPNLSPWDIAGLEHARNLTNKPPLAVGGIRLSNTFEAVTHGADGIVVVSSILKAENPASSARSLLTEIASARTSNLCKKP